MKKEKRDFVHTGDVQVIESVIPSNAKPIPKEPVAYGEKSGHLHVITGDYEMLSDGTFHYVKVGKKGAYSQHVHESNFNKVSGYDSLELLEKADHKPARLLPNKVYKVGVHQAYDPYKKIKERVID